MLGQTTWLIDGRTGREVSYFDLLVRLNRRPLDACALQQAMDTAGVLEGIALAIVHETDLVLFDADFGDDEIAALGFKRSQINMPRALENPVAVDQALLQKRAGGASRARLGLFTSGSTGLPKLVFQGIGNLARAVRVSPRHAEAVWALAYNPTHVAGVQVYLQALANGCSLLDVYGMNRRGVLEALERYEVTHLSATPSFYRLLLPIDRPLLAVKSVTLGGESADAKLLAKVQELFPNARIHNVYASTEAGTLLVAADEVFAIAPGLEGKVTVRDGKLSVHHTLLGEFVGCTAVDIWYDTGDVIETVSEQPLRFRIVARERDWVNVGGSKVNPQEVESVLVEHAGVTQARVFGRKNSVMGNLLCAEVVPGVPVPTEAELRLFLAERLQPFKIPRIIRFIDSLGTTRTGKLSRI